MLKLTLKDQPNVPLEAEALSPDLTAGLSPEAVRALPVYLGKRQLRVADFFQVDGTPGEGLEIHGEADRVKWIGRGMTRGHVAIVGNAGMHLGAYMKGGTIEVSGNVSDWLGAEMSGGSIRVRGNAGGQVGGAYRGSLSGMRDGTIVIDGSAGLEVGMRMRRGLIAVGGPVRDFAGLEMKGGTIVLRGGAELRTGAWMSRGTIVSVPPIPLLPTFRHASDYNPPFLRLWGRYLSTLGFPIPYEDELGTYRRYLGDASVPGKGEILVFRPRVG
jgi:formylmethanofuran dehydrogenase subunit C